MGSNTTEKGVPSIIEDRRTTSPILLEEGLVRSLGGTFPAAEIDRWRKRIRSEVVSYLERKFDRFFSSPREVRLKINEALTTDFGLGFPLDAKGDSRSEACLLVYRSFLEILLDEELPEEEILKRLGAIHEEIRLEYAKQKLLINAVLAEELLVEAQRGVPDN